MTQGPEGSVARRASALTIWVSFRLAGGSICRPMHVPCIVGIADQRLLVTCAIPTRAGAALSDSRSCERFASCLTPIKTPRLGHQRMLVLISSNGRPPQQLLITKRTSLEGVQSILQLPTGPCEWQTDDGSWALADLEAKLFDVADDLKGDGSSDGKAFHVRALPPPSPAPAPAGVRNLPRACISATPIAERSLHVRYLP